MKKWEQENFQIFKQKIYINYNNIIYNEIAWHQTLVLVVRLLSARWGQVGPGSADGARWGQVGSGGVSCSRPLLSCVNVVVASDNVVPETFSRLPTWRARNPGDLASSVYK